jgi:nucleoside-diphosphate-sugar epimerase
VLRESGGPGVVLRLGGIYGPGRTRLVESVRDGSASIAPGPPRYTNRIQRDDCAGATAHILRLAEPAPIYVGVDCDPAEERVVLEWVAARLGVASPTVRAADAEGDASARSGSGGRGIVRRGNKRCRNARLVASGYTFRYPTFREGYESVLSAGVSEPRDLP